MWIAIPITLYIFSHASDVKCSMWDQLLQHLGLGLITINQRLNAHRRFTAENKTKDEFINRHFSQPDHEGLTDVRVRLID